MIPKSIIGAGIDRVDGPLKVTGGAVAEHNRARQHRFHGYASRRPSAGRSGGDHAGERAAAVQGQIP